MELAAKRNFEVNYYEKDECTWLVESHLIDNPHDICLLVEVNMNDFIITDAQIKFNKYPMKHCNLMEKKAEELIGLKVDNTLIDKAILKLMGPEGCPNLIQLLNISVPGILYYYYPYKIQTGKMKPETFQNIINTDLKNACLGHTLNNNTNIYKDFPYKK